MAKKTSSNPESNGVYFLSLSIEGARCFGEKQELDLSDGEGRPARWTIILGDNGTGKTTILPALAAFSPALSIRSVAAYRDGDGEFEPYLMKGDHIGLFLHDQREEANLEAEIALTEPYSFARTSPAKRAVTSLSISRWRQPPASGIGVSWQRPSEKGVNLPCCYAYSAGRRLAPAAMGNGQDDHHAVANLFDDSVPLRNAEEWLLQLDYSSRIPSPIQPRQRQRFEQVRQLLLHILPEITDLRISTPSERHPVPRTEFLTPYGWVHLRNLGYGYQTLIAWMVDLAGRLVERSPDSADPLAEPAVVLVDEIDLHLHPKWQRQVIPHLTERFPNAQFVVTAHSPLVVQSAPDANIVLLRCEGDHVVIDNDVQSVHGWRVDQIYTSELFGLATARPVEVEALLLRRRELLTKPKLSERDKRELRELEEKIGELPAGESAAHLESMRHIEDSLKLIKQQLEAQP